MNSFLTLIRGINVGGENADGRAKTIPRITRFFECKKLHCKRQYHSPVKRASPGSKITHRRSFATTLHVRPQTYYDARGIAGAATYYCSQQAQGFWRAARSLP